MITTAICTLRKAGERKTHQTKMYDSHGLAVGNEYNVNLDGDKAVWRIVHIKDEPVIKKEGTPL
jgi:hypothetical protein